MPEKRWETVRLSAEGGVATIVLQNPPLNLLTIRMMQDLAAALRAADAEESARVVLIRGNGKCFSAGANVEEHLPERAEEMLEAFDHLFAALFAVRVPTAAALHGAALGGGFELGVLCDLSLASAGCKLGLPEIRLGVFPPLAAAVLPRWIGVKPTLDLILTGRTITAQEARSAGLVQGVFDDARFPDDVSDFIRPMSALSRPALMFAKKAVREWLDMPVTQATRNIDTLYRRDLMAHPDAVEGLKAFMEKRAPVWRS